MSASGVLSGLSGSANHPTASLAISDGEGGVTSSEPAGGGVIVNQTLATTATVAAAAAARVMSPLSQRPLGFLDGGGGCGGGGGGGGYVGALSVLIKGLPEMLLRQFEYEDPVVRGGKHLLHSSFFKELVALACDLGLDALLCAGGEGDLSTPAS